MHLAIIGVEGRVSGGNLALKNLLWDSEWGLVENNLDLLYRDSLDLALKPKYLSLDKADLIQTEECPPVFLSYCYQIPMRSWGNSGGALLVSDHREIDAKTRMAGLVLISVHFQIEPW